MRKLGILFFLLLFLPAKPLLSHDIDEGLRMILGHKDECVQKIAKDKIYFYPEVLQEKDGYLAIEFSDYQQVLFPYLFQDEQGVFLVCNSPNYYGNLFIDFDESFAAVDQLDSIGNSEFRLILVRSRSNRDSDRSGGGRDIDRSGGGVEGGITGKWGDEKGIQWEGYVKGEVHDSNGNYAEGRITQRDDGTGEIDVRGGHEINKN